MSIDLYIQQAKHRARHAFAEGMGHNSNPYPDGTPQREAYMLEINRLQYEEFIAEETELRAGV
jgi:hypothetical protein